MKNVRVAELKNKLSAYLDQVEQGEEILVKNREKAIARIVPLKPMNAAEEERQLVAEGKLRLPAREMSKKFLETFLSVKMPVISTGTSVEALIRDRSEN
jgi:prevent-host-death family protein